MYAEIILRTIKPHSIKPKIYTVGGFEFVLPNGKHVNFDWNDSATCITDDNGHMVFTTNLHDFELDVYEEALSENGLVPSDVTIELLMQVVKIEEVCYECFTDDELETAIPCEVVGFIIDKDDNTCTFRVPASLINEYNRLVGSEPVIL